MKIVLPLPGTLTSQFIVAMEHLTFDIESFVPWRVGGPFRRAATSALATGALTVTHHPTPWRPTGLTFADEERRRLRRTSEHIVVSTTAPPHKLPATIQAARATARALARQCDGLLIDPLTGSSILTCGRCAGEPTDFHLKDDWLSWDVQVHDAATCPPWDPADTDVCDCLRVTSRGLHRFALPEITLDGAACAHNLCATNLLRTVAHRLTTDHLAYVTTHPAATSRQIDDFLQIHPAGQLDGGLPFGVQLTPYDAALGELGRTGSIRRLKVGPPPGTGQITCLKVGPPSGFTGSLNDWLCATQEAGHTTLTPLIDSPPLDPAPALAA
ncbi:hypothetical protein [Nonomuraea jiangxiensis]|uniref:Uncharacterized protein n=1 Tax=Nonomuraea jiangxiensis TaxID=633440 RepID=A0A1G8V1H8_9ACTN|nr:hypothetical protein [Nonomuraea jiangxiensis]SDJ59215.1 hypothetical protein SAMN05421869_111148 [Nonomuraea jiangxiensis]